MLSKIALALLMMTGGAWIGALGEEWPAEPKRNFTQECQAACRINSRLTSDAQKTKCPDYCQCLIDEGERLFTAAEFRQMDEDARNNRDTSLLRRFMKPVEDCNRRTFGG